jgi:hypothetical protein
MVSEEKIRKDARDEIRELVQSRFAKARDTSLQDIQDVFQKPPYELSEGTVINYLNELVDTRKLSTWRVKNRRYYGPPKIPLPIKFGLSASAIIIGVSVLIDIFVPQTYFSYIYLKFGEETPSAVPHATMLPIVFYSIILISIFTAAWYLSQRKLNK